MTVRRKSGVTPNKINLVIIENQLLKVYSIPE